MPGHEGNQQLKRKGKDSSGGQAEKWGGRGQGQHTAESWPSHTPCTRCFMSALLPQEGQWWVGSKEKVGSSRSGPGDVK